VSVGGDDRVNPGTFLDGLADDDLSALRTAAQHARYAAGDLVLREGDPPTVVLVLLGGTVKLSSRRVAVKSCSSCGARATWWGSWA
jgi:hypothetical protein